MKPSPLRLERPGTLAEVLEALAPGDAKVLAGGQSLVPLLSMRLAAPARVVDLGRVPGLDAVEVSDGEVRLGAMVRHARVERHEAAAAALPLLRRAVRHVAHPTIRNRGTTVGSVVHADPSGEVPAVLALLGGHVVARSTAGERRVQAADLFTGPLETTLRADEVVVAAVFPRLPATTGTAVVEVARRHGDYAVCGVVAAVDVRDGRVESARATYVTAGELGRVYDLTDALRSGVDDAAAHARDVVEVDGDIHATAAYRSQLVRVLTARALRAAVDDAARGAAA